MPCGAGIATYRRAVDADCGSAAFSQKLCRSAISHQLMLGDADWASASAAHRSFAGVGRKGERRRKRSSACAPTEAANERQLSKCLAANCRPDGAFSGTEERTSAGRGLGSSQFAEEHWRRAFGPCSRPPGAPETDSAPPHPSALWPTVVGTMVHGSGGAPGAVRGSGSRRGDNFSKVRCACRVLARSCRANVR